MKFRILLFLNLFLIGSSEAQDSVSLDLTFGQQGKQILDCGPIEHISKLCTDSTGSIYFIGYRASVDSTINRDYLLGKLLADGSLDTDFGNQGWVEADFPGYDHCTGVDGTIVSDGILLFGHGGTYGNSSNQSIFLAKFHFDGTIDISYGNQGYYQAQYRGDYNIAECLVPFSGDTVLIGGATFDTVGGHREIGFVGRILPSGIPDSTFGSTGIRTWDGLGGLQNGRIPETATNRHADGSMIKSISVNESKEVYASGYYDPGAESWNLIVGFDQNGDLITSFGNSGILVYQLDPTLHNVVVSSVWWQNKLVLGIEVVSNGSFVVQSISSIGAIENEIYLQEQGMFHRISELAIYEDRLMVTGEMKEDTNVAPGYTSDYFNCYALDSLLNLDSSFFGNGIGVWYDHFNTEDEAASFAMVATNRGLVLGGQLNNLTTNNYEDVGFMRLKKPDVITDVIQPKDNVVNHIKVYPNPAVSSVELSISSKANYSIFNVQGELVEKGEYEPGVRLDLPLGIDSGFYIISLIDMEGNYYTAKFVVR